MQIIHILHSRYHPKITGHILKNKQKNKCVDIHEIIRLIIIKRVDENKNRSHKYDIKRLRSRHGTNMVNKRVSQYDDAFLY